MVLPTIPVPIIAIFIYLVAEANTNSIQNRNKLVSFLFE